jgi:hypothetical protein
LLFFEERWSAVIPLSKERFGRMGTTM